MDRPRDSQRSRLYTAEEVLKPLSKRYAEMPELEAFVKRVAARSTLLRWYPELARPIRVGDGRMRRRAGGDRYGIYMPRWSRCTYVILHELSHMIAERKFGSDVVPWHGPEFCRIYGNLVGNVMGQEAWRTLRASFKKHRVKMASF